MDTAKETVELVEAGKSTVAELARRLPSSEPRFVFFKFVHTFNGASAEPNSTLSSRSRCASTVLMSALIPSVFIYWCPEGAPIKSKMLYSTVKVLTLHYACFLHCLTQ